MIKPRSYRPDGQVLDKTLAIMLKSHPEAFDCIIWPAKDSGHDEILAVNESVATLLDRDERRQEFDGPILGRAMIAPSQTLDFEATDSGLYESFNTATEAFNLLLSEPGLRLHTIVQWREELDLAGNECVERNVYVARVLPIAKTIHAGNVYVCYPLPAMGEKPDAPKWTASKKTEPDPCPETPPEVGLL